MKKRKEKDFEPPFPGKDIDNSLGLPLEFDEIPSLDKKNKKSRENQKKDS